MNYLPPKSDRRRTFLLSDSQSNALHGNEYPFKTLPKDSSCPSSAMKTVVSVAMILSVSFSVNEYAAKRHLYDIKAG